jgi:hypothetical protein
MRAGWVTRATCAVWGNLLVAIGLLASLSAPSRADDGITQHVARNYSLFAPSDCQRTDRPGLDVALDCRFANFQAQVYLKEDRTFTRPSSPQDTVDWAEPALADVLMNVDRSMIDRIRLFGGSSVYDPPGRKGGVFVRYGFRYKSIEDSKRMSQDFEKRVVVIVYQVEGIGAARLVAISDVDQFSITDPSRGGFGVPSGVLAMCASLGLKYDRALIQ